MTRYDLEFLVTASHNYLKTIASGRDWSDRLCGGCAFGSVLLSKMLHQRGIRNKIVWANDGIIDHVYLRVGKLVVDVTAHQFLRFRPIFIGHVSKAKYLPISKVKTIDSSKANWKKIDREFKGWPFKDQPRYAFIAKAEQKIW